MSQPVKPSGDHIVVIDPSASSAEAEKLKSDSPPLTSIKPPDPTNTDPEQKTNIENSYLDGEAKPKTRLQRLRPLLFRLVFLIVPACLFAIPIFTGFWHNSAKDAQIGGVWMRWFFIWVEVFWCSIWVSSIIARWVLPRIARLGIGIFSKKAKKYRYVIAELEIPLTFFGWAFASFISFHPLTYNNDPQPSRIEWRRPTAKVLAGFLVTSVIYLIKSVLIQVVYIRYRQAQLADKVAQNKENIKLLTKLYVKSREIYPDESVDKLREEDNVLNDAITFAVGNLVFDHKSPEEHGNWAEASARVIWALENRKLACPPLAKRIWKTFAKDGEESMFQADLEPCFPKELDIVTRSFAMLDRDYNGDITLDEMITAVLDIARERKALYSGWSDSEDIVSSFSALLNVVVIGLAILVFLGFLTNIGSAFGYAGTVIAALGFAFGGTITEMVASIIFIFVKHPFDVGDFVNIGTHEYIVEHISLLYVQVRNVADNKYTHFPNSVLNSMMVENVTRSKAMFESFTLQVSSDTNMDDIDTLREEVRKFIDANPRDFYTREEDLIVDMNAFTMDSIEVKVQIKYKGNYADGKRGKRKVMVLKEILAAVRSIPLYGAGGGSAALGSSDNPSFGVSVTAEDAKSRFDTFRQEQELRRLKRSS